MADRRPNPFGYATPLGEGLGSVFNAFLQAPTPEDRAANALKIYGLQAGAKADLANAGKLAAEQEKLDIGNTALRALPGLDFSAPDAQGTVMQTMGGNYSSLADPFLVHLARQPDATPQSLDTMAYAKNGNAPNTFQGMAITDATNRRGQDVTAQTQRYGHDLTYKADIYNTDQTQAGLDRRFSVNTPANSITTVPANSPIATSPTGNTTIEGIRTNTAGAGSQTPRNYRTPQGKTGLTYDGLTDIASGESLPQGTELAGTRSLDGATEAQGKAAGYALRMEGAMKTLASLPKNFDPTTLIQNLVADATVPLTDQNIGNYVVNKNFQQYLRAARDVAALILRGDSGAAVTAEEVLNYGLRYLPAPGDEQPVLKDKADAIARAYGGFAAQAGPALDAARKAYTSIIADPQMQPAYAGGGPVSSVTPQPGDTYAPQPGAPAPAGPTQNAAQLLQDAQNALARGADRAAVAARYKQMTGQDLP